MEHAPLTDKEERIATAIVNAAYAVHKALGPGLLERIYEVCFCHELGKRGLSFRRQVVVPIIYDGIRFEEGLWLDVLVEESVICELKAKTAWLFDQRAADQAGHQTNCPIVSLGAFVASWWET